MRPTVGLRGALSVVLLVLGCGGNPLNPSDVQGDWAGRDVPSHFAILQIRFELKGSVIEGRACRIDGPHLSFTDAPVTLNGRRVTMRVTERGVVSVWEGDFDAAGTEIRGAWKGNAFTATTLARGGTYCSEAR
jgi:hypothetical protein